jgi:hypothetical protein
MTAETVEAFLARMADGRDVAYEPDFSRLLAMANGEAFASAGGPEIGGQMIHIVYSGHGSPEGYSEPLAAFTDKAEAALFIFEENEWWKGSAKIKSMVLQHEVPKKPAP